MDGPLTGIKILDFTRFQNGPHATVMLSDMGAEIIKIDEHAFIVIMMMSPSLPGAYRCNHFCLFPA